MGSNSIKHPDDVVKYEEKPRHKVERLDNNSKNHNTRSFWVEKRILGLHGNDNNEDEDDDTMMTVNSFSSLLVGSTLKQSHLPLDLWYLEVWTESSLDGSSIDRGSYSTG